MEHYSLCIVKNRHLDDSCASKGHVVEVGGQGELIAERLDAVRQSEFSPREQFTVCGIRVDRLERSSLVWFWTTSL